MGWMKTDMFKHNEVPTRKPLLGLGWDHGTPTVPGALVTGLEKGKLGLLRHQIPATQLRRLEHLGNPRNSLKVAEI